MNMGTVSAAMRMMVLLALLAWTLLLFTRVVHAEEDCGSTDVNVNCNIGKTTTLGGLYYRVMETGTCTG